MTPTEKLLEAAKDLRESATYHYDRDGYATYVEVERADIDALEAAIAEFEAQEREPRESWPATLREIANGLGYTNQGWSQALRLIADGIEQPTTARR